MSIKPWAGVLVAGIGGAMLFIPHSETYQSTTFYEYLEVKIDCGNPMDSTVHFSDGIGDLISKNDPIFEGKSANRVCKDVDSKNRTTALVVLGLGVVGFFVALSTRRSKQPVTFTPRPAPAAGPGPAATPARPATAVEKPAAVANPARWTNDPFERHEFRYWNGKKWTDQVSDQGVVSRDPAVATPQPSPAALTPPSPAAGTLTPPAATPAAATPVVPVVAPSIVVPPVVAPVAAAPAAPVAAPPPPPPAAAAAPAPSPHHADEHDNHTVPRRALPTRPNATFIPVRLAFDSGQGTTLQGPLVIGRNPSPVPSLPAAGLLSYDDDTMTVSKTHLVIGQDAGEVWVEDLGSSNGTAIVDDNGAETPVPPRTRTTVALGSTIRFGDRWVQVRRQGVDGE